MTYVYMKIPGEKMWAILQYHQADQKQDKQEARHPGKILKGRKPHSGRYQKICEGERVKAVKIWKEADLEDSKGKTVLDLNLNVQNKEYFIRCFSFGYTACS